jgi:molecular chaperone HtpG
MTDLKSETRDFSAEVGKVLHLMINALYTNKDTCLRELISNAADACDKLRYLSQFDSSLCGSHPEPKITICIDKQNNTLSVRDSGIGMNKEDLLNYLGSIASSGTQKFLEKMTGDDKNDNTLIGQFGVGFYSVFMIGDKVEVKTRKAGDDQRYLWASNGSGSYTISNLEEKCEGTEVIVYLKESESNYLDFDYVKSVILKYSDNVAVPIFLEESLDQRNDQINSAKALWTLNRSEISQDQYKEFYQRVFYASDSPWKILHNKNEGSGSFTNLLFIPSEKTFDLFSSDRKRRVKLYVKRVFVTEEGVDLIPYYLRFVRGVIDTDSLSLNISREMIQSSSVLATIRRVVTSRVLKVLKEALQSEIEEYQIFWANFGAVLKEGLCEDSANNEALLELCLFYSAMQKRHVTLNQYSRKPVFRWAEKYILYHWRIFAELI